MYISKSAKMLGFVVIHIIAVIYDITLFLLYLLFSKYCVSRGM